MLKLSLLLLTLADCAEKIFVDLVDGRVNKPEDIEALFVLRFSEEIVMDVLAVGHDTFGTIRNEVWVEDCLALARSSLG